MSAKLEMHSHCFVTGPRSKDGYRNGVWTKSEFSHSHADGGIPHRHPDTGPAFFGHRKPKLTAKPNGEQFEFIRRTEEENTFELIVTDSALLSVPRPIGSNLPGLVPIGDTPLEALGFPAADTMMLGFRMKCVVRDERKKQA